MEFFVLQHILLTMKNIFISDNEVSKIFMYSSLIPIPEFYDRLEKLPEDDKIRRAAMEGLGEYY